MSSLSDDLIRKAWRRLLQMHKKSNAGHLGGNLSCLETLLCLYHSILTEQDRFVLSKGHAVGAHYVSLWSAGYLSEEALRSFGRDATEYPHHPPLAGLPLAPFATGSLGHGLSLACGLALGMKLAGSPGEVFCLTSDGEWQEGQTWEALTFALTHRLTNLCILIDHNGWQGFGKTSEIDSASSLDTKVRGFGADVLVLDGHDYFALEKSLQDWRSNLRQRPGVMVLETVKGRGLGVWEDSLLSHYAKLDDRAFETLLEMSPSCAENS
jgi:transketolase